MSLPTEVAAAFLPLEELAAMPCPKGRRHRWSRKAGRLPKCKGCDLADFRELAGDGDPEPRFDPAEHRAAVRHAILTGQVLG